MHITTDDARAALVAGNGRVDVAALLYVSLALGASLAADDQHADLTTTDQRADQRADRTGVR